MGRFWHQMRGWERSAQAAFALALFLLAITISVVVWGPEHLRQPALIGSFGLVVVGQIIVMWANRGLVTTYTQAQRLYLAEDFEGACQLLEAVRTQGKADARVLALLGNAYRQRCLLTKSEEILTEALTKQPSHYFPLYGFGRTLLVQGRYAEAVEIFDQALVAGGSAVVQLAAGEANYRSGQLEKAGDLIAPILGDISESHHQLMGTYLLYRLNRRPVPSVHDVTLGLDYWQAQAERFHQTPYGQALAEDVLVMQSMLIEET